MNTDSPPPKSTTEELLDAMRPRSLANELSQSLHSKPDPNTYAWFNRKLDELAQGYRGANHSINMAVANTRDNEARITKFAEIIEAFKLEHHDLRADMGQMMAENSELRDENSALRNEIASIQKRIADMAAWAATKGKQLPDQKG